jgi:RHS repeat-associated protein
VRNAEQNAIRYNWGTGNRLLGIQEEWTGKQTTFNYDAFDNLTKAEYSERNAVSAVYRIPDAIGNLFETPYRNDRKYDRGGRLTEDPNHFYHYDCEGNLVFKEFKKPQGYSSLGKAALQKKYGIRFKATATGWLYEWSAGGMLERVVNPQQGKVTFGYDALGRRVYKEVKHTRTNWLWDGNVPLHEWQTTEKEPLIDIVTWVFEEGAFVPAARITEHNSQSILTDYLGTPIEMYGANGEKTWKAQLDIYGRVRTFVGSSLSDCPFRYQGQYQDSETGLYYNRFRYYDPDTGNYLSQDPIRLNGGIQLYGYVKDTNAWLDVLGLAANRGRIQAQGTHLEKSVSWDKTTPLTVSEGLSMVDELESKLSKSERKLRQSELEKVRNFIKNAGEAGGVDAPVSKTFQVKGTKHERIDIEVNSGTAFVPDENTKIKGYH